MHSSVTNITGARTKVCGYASRPAAATKPASAGDHHSGVRAARTSNTSTATVSRGVTICEFPSRLKTSSHDETDEMHKVMTASDRSTS